MTDEEATDHVLAALRKTKPVLIAPRTGYLSYDDYQDVIRTFILEVVRFARTSIASSTGPDLLAWARGKEDEET